MLLRRLRARSTQAECATKQWLVLDIPSPVERGTALYLPGQIPKKSGLLFKKQRPGPRRKQLRAINLPNFVWESDVFEACMHVMYYVILKYALCCYWCFQIKRVFRNHRNPLLLSIFLSSFSSSYNPLMQTLNPSFCITRRRIFSTISSILIHLVSLHQSYCRERVLFKTCVMKEWTDMMRYLIWSKQGGRSGEPNFMFLSTFPFQDASNPVTLVWL